MSVDTRRNHVKWIAFLGLMAALVIAGSWIRVPTSIGTFNLGNIMCALAGILFGPVGGGLAAGVGSMLYDIIFYPAYIAECWITFLTKGALALTAGLVAWSAGKRGLSTRRNAAAAAVGAFTYLALYLVKAFLWNGLFQGSLSPDGALALAVSKAPMSLFNAVLASVCAPILAAAIQKALSRAKLSLT